MILMLGVLIMWTNVISGIIIISNVTLSGTKYFYQPVLVEIGKLFGTQGLVLIGELNALYLEYQYLAGDGGGIGGIGFILEDGVDHLRYDNILLHNGLRFSCYFYLYSFVNCFLALLITKYL